MAELKATIAIEKVLIHEALKDAIQKIATDHGIMITDVNVDWQEFLGHSPEIKSFEVRTRS